MTKINRRMMMITIGIPRALLYFKYRYLWETFFTELDCRIVLSGESNRQTLSDGIQYSIDEACLPSKIFMGHVHELMGKCDYILVPRVDNFGKDEQVCVKFNAMYDIVRNTFQNISLIAYNLDVSNGHREMGGFIRMGRTLNKPYHKTFFAYKKAKKVQALKQTEKAAAQMRLLDRENRLKILIVTHPYNIYDRLLGKPIVEIIKTLGGIPVYADLCCGEKYKKRSEELSKQLYWSFNKELVGGVSVLKNKIDGIVFLTAFPCGPDSLVNELLLRKIKDTPMANIILDELQGEAGLQTRLESFLDIIREKKRRVNG